MLQIRAMIMENLIFVGFVLALGIVLYSLKQYFEHRHAKRIDLAKDRQAAPPRKRTISGPNPLDEAQVHFQQRIEDWQRTQMSRWSALKHTADGISGERYQPDPESWRKTNRYPGQAASHRVQQQFKLLG